MLTTLSEIIEIKNGKNQKDVEKENGQYPIYGSGGVIGRATEYICPPNTVVIGRKGSINNPLFVEEPFWNVDTAFGLVANEAYLLPKYLFFFCKHYDFERLNTTVTIPSLTKANINSIRIKLPSLAEQTRIVQKLEKTCLLIDSYHRELGCLNELIKSRFVEEFGDPILNPNKWPVRRVGELVTDVRYGTSRPAVEGGRYPYLRMNNLTNDGRLDLTNLKYINIPDNELEKCLVRYGDILFNRTNSIDLIGKTAVFNLEEPMIIAGYIIRVRLKDELLPDIFALYFNLEYMKDALKKMAKGAVNQANINAQELQSINIYVPPIERQEAFVEFLQSIDKSKAVIQKSLNEAQLLFDSLMQEYFG